MVQPTQTAATQPSEFNKKIVHQGNVVRELETQKADKTEVDAAVKVLLDLKAQYKALTGVDWKPEGAAASGPRAKEAKPAKQNKQQVKQPAQKEKEKDGTQKKQTRLGLEATKEDNLPDWYSQGIKI